MKTGEKLGDVPTKILTIELIMRIMEIGVIGFEPTASCSQSRRSSQAELHPGYFNSLVVQNLRNLFFLVLVPSYNLSSSSKLTYFQSLSGSAAAPLRRSD